MATPISFSEEKCLTVCWKIKNFTFCCEDIQSPEFTIYENRYYLSVRFKNEYVDIHLIGPSSNPETNLKREISVLTCDGSPETTIFGGRCTYLSVQKNTIFEKRRDSVLPEDTLTIRFRTSTTPERKKRIFCSEIGVKRTFFLWNHQRFSKSGFNAEKSVETSKQYGDIKLVIKSTGGFNTDQRLSIEISRTSGEWCFCVLKISILGEDGKALSEVSDELVFDGYDDEQTVVFRGFSNTILQLTSKNLLETYKTLSLKCDFAMSLGSLEDQTSVTSYCGDFLSLVKESDDLSVSLNEEKDSGALAELQADLKAMLDDVTFCDATLQIGDEDIRVHKSILSSRSPVFRAMFTKGIKEGIDRICIEDIDLETVRRLLLYIYTDSVRDDRWENMKKLYFAADKYQLMGLKKKCVSFLKADLSVSNVCETLLLADLCQDENLKVVLFDFISQHYFEVYALNEWKNLEKYNPLLTFKVKDVIYNRKASEITLK